ncbi:RING-H2 finger protein ATL70-like [Gastrolobium bilobum]|uniref:RING-H2 finger protein ATL70-like n=1 Tax=Gastrolobium bilobum TaxID=150636 RepID=UPI002AB1C3BE|nr:RING-H2 finger protein ATL70-like [Gastrolobium bilobum]
MNNTSINSDDNPSDNQHGYAYYSIGLSLMVLIVITVLTLISYYCSRGSLQNRQVRATANTSMELDSSALTIQIHQEEASLNCYPMLLYSEAKQHKPDSATITSCCSICLADYKDTDLLQLLPDCGHAFHRDCINRWLQVNLSCPVCRTTPLPTPISTPLAEVVPLAARRD